MKDETYSSAQEWFDAVTQRGLIAPEALCNSLQHSMDTLGLSCKEVLRLYTESGVVIQAGPVYMYSPSREQQLLVEQA